MMESADVLLKLILAALGKEGEYAFPVDVAWDEVLRLADAQGVAAIAADGIGKTGARIPFGIKMEFASRVVMHEQVYRRHEELMAKLAKAYRKKGLRMMVLKGWGLSLDYPIPSHRPSGDLDIWNFGRWKEADEYIASRGVRIDNSHHHHSVFSIEELTVENHYDFINTHAHRSSKVFEAKLKEIANREYREKNVGGERIYLPSADFNMLFLLRHSANHFVGKEMTLRQLLDWALFVEHHHREIHWDDCLKFLQSQGLYRYFNILALICVEQLGFSRDVFHCELQEDELKHRVLADIIEPEFNEKLGRNPVGIIVGKTRRWWANRWKHRLCYPDSLLSGFVYGVWAKIEKPSHFLH